MLLTMITCKLLLHTYKPTSFSQVRQGSNKIQQKHSRWRRLQYNCSYLTSIWGPGDTILLNLYVQKTKCFRKKNFVPLSGNKQYHHTQGQWSVAKQYKTGSVGKICHSFFNISTHTVIPRQEAKEHPCWPPFFYLHQILL